MVLSPTSDVSGQYITALAIAPSNLTVRLRSHHQSC
jgi:hypothetical protein